MHALITIFIPWNVIKYYWRLATKNTSFIVWIAQAQVQHTAAYISKYITKDLTTASFQRGERPYGMSKSLRKAWPKLKAEISDIQKIEYMFTYKPDNRSIIRKAVDELNERKNSVRNVNQKCLLGTTDQSISIKTVCNRGGNLHGHNVVIDNIAPEGSNCEIGCKPAKWQMYCKDCGHILRFYCDEHAYLSHGDENLERKVKRV